MAGTFAAEAAEQREHPVLRLLAERHRADAVNRGPLPGALEELLRW